MEPKPQPHAEPAPAAPVSESPPDAAASPPSDPAADPLVRKAMELFNARIVDVRRKT